MRSLTRRAGEDDEQESSFVSMTDLTVSFLFIVMPSDGVFCDAVCRRNAGSARGSTFNAQRRQGCVCSRRCDRESRRSSRIL